MAREGPTRAHWDELRPALVEWYKKRTANSIADELKREHGLNVTPKMLRDRFREWGVEPKYNRHKPRQPQKRKQNVNAALPTLDGRKGGFVLVPAHHVHAASAAQSGGYAYTTFYEASQGRPSTSSSMLTTRDSDTPSDIDSVPPVPAASTPLLTPNDYGLNSLLLCPGITFPEPSRTPDTPLEDFHLHKTLAEIHGFLNRISENRSWRETIEEPCSELQKLAANAHMTTSSLAYDCRQVWRELADLQANARTILPKFRDPDRKMHPRVLTIMLRLLVREPSRPLWESRIMEKVKNMFYVLAFELLGGNHPITMLCGMPSNRTNDLLWRQVELVKSEFYCNAKLEDPSFVARELIYSARVLASLGYPDPAITELESLLSSLDLENDQYTLADAHRTLGFSNFHSAEADEAQGEPKQAHQKYLAARSESEYALNIFKRIGMANIENVMYTHHHMAITCRKLAELEESEAVLRSALDIWEINRTDPNQKQGAVKMVRDLDQVLFDLGKTEASVELRKMYPKYFEESPDATPLP